METQVDREEREMRSYFRDTLEHTDGKHLTWVYYRLRDVHNESPHMDYMHRLRACVLRVIAAEKSEAAPSTQLPMQPIHRAPDGAIRFRENKVVEYLLENFPREDREQFAQLIGYSISGFAELSYVSDEASRAADALRDTLLGLEHKEGRREPTLGESIENAAEVSRVNTCYVVLRRRDQ